MKLLTTALWWMAHNFTYDMSKLVQVMSWHRQARSMSLYATTKPPWVRVISVNPKSRYQFSSAATLSPFTNGIRNENGIRSMPHPHIIITFCYAIFKSFCSGLNVFNNCDSAQWRQYQATCIIGVCCMASTSQRPVHNGWLDSNALTEHI